MMPSIAGALGEAFDVVDVAALGLAWARAMPTVALVPAFGLRALPAPARAVMGLALASSIFPALVPIAARPDSPWVALAVVEFARGLPVAIAAAVPLWAATMAGGLADSLRGYEHPSSAPTVVGRATPLGIMLSLLASAIFLFTGGAARVCSALALHPVGERPLVAAADDLVGGIALAIGVGGPLLAASVIIELVAALIARAAAPAQVHSLLAPLRALAMLAVIALLLERLAVAVVPR
jgi:type III secretory pathway component EscT